MTTFTYVLLGMPPALLADGVEHSDELFREAQLLGRAADPGSVAARIERWHRRLYDAGDGRELMLEAFRAERRAGAIELPIGAEHDLVELGLLLDEADEACDRGELLTLPRPPALAALNWWAITEAVRQRRGLPPTPYAGPVAA